MTSRKGPTAVFTDLHVPSIRNPDGDLIIDSGGDLFVSFPGSPRALTISTDGDDVTGTTLVTAGSKELAFKTPDSSLKGDELSISAPGTLTCRAGTEVYNVTSVSAESSEAGLLGTGVDDSRGSYLQTVSATSGSDLVLSNDGVAGQECTIEMTKAGSAYYRSNEHSFFVGGEEILTIGRDEFVIHKNLEIHGTLTTIGGTVNELRVEDALIHVATGAESEAQVSSSASGLCIETVPGGRGDVPYMSGYRDDDGSALFVALNNDGAEVIDANKAAKSEIFHKHFVHHVNGGAQASGQRTTLSRASEPYWEVNGGALRMSRFCPVESAPGTVSHYAVVLRVADTGAFEVARTKTTMTHIAGTNSFASSAPEFALLQACEVQ